MCATQGLALVLLTWLICLCYTRRRLKMNLVLDSLCTFSVLLNDKKHIRNIAVWVHIMLYKPICVYSTYATDKTITNITTVK